MYTLKIKFLFNDINEFDLFIKFFYQIFNKTPLLRVIEDDNIEVAKLLVSHLSIDINYKDIFIQDFNGI